MKRLLALALASSALVITSPTWADESTQVVHPTQETWYATAGSCDLPPVCGSAATTLSYPADTLHVGVQLGQEAARTYLGFGVKTHPAGRRIGSALLRLPVATDAGTNNLADALLQVCEAPQGLAAATPATPPVVDCAAGIRAFAVTSTPPSFEADISPLVAKHGDLNGLVLAIMPVTELAAAAAVPASYHVGFSTHERKGGAPIQVELGLQVPETGTTLAPEPVPPALVLPDPPALVGLPALPDVPTVVSAPAVQVPEVKAPVVQAPTRLVPRALVLKGGRYGSVWALPFMLFLLGWFLTTTGRRDLRSLAPHVG